MLSDCFQVNIFMIAGHFSPAKRPVWLSNEFSFVEVSKHQCDTNAESFNRKARVGASTNDHSLQKKTKKIYFKTERRTYHQSTDIVSGKGGKFCFSDVQGMHCPALHRHRNSSSKRKTAVRFCTQVIFAVCLKSAVKNCHLR